MHRTYIHTALAALLCIASLSAVSCSGSGGGGSKGSDSRQQASTISSPVRIAHVDPGHLAVSYYVAGEVRIINASTLLTESSFRPYGKPLAVAFSNGILFVSNQYEPAKANVDAYTPDGQYLYTASGGYGTLKRPSDMAVDASRELLFVVDSSDAKVYVYNMYNGTSVRSFPGTFTVGSQKVVHPTGIALDTQNSLVFVSDYGGVAGAHGTGAARVQVYNYMGIHQRTVASNQTGYEFSTPQGLAIGQDWLDLYLVDALQGRVLVFNSSGSGIASMSNIGMAEGELLLPLDVTLHDPSGDVFVTNNRMDRIEVFRGAMQ